MREKLLFITVIFLYFTLPVHSAQNQNLGSIDPGYIYFKVGIHGQPSTPEFEYNVATNDSDVIAQCLEQLSLPEDRRDLHVNGALDWNDGGFNEPWSWHIVPDDWNLAGMSAEVCDGYPKYVEENLDYWINSVGRFCCYDSYIKGQLEIGDVNADGVIDVLDVVRAVHIILETGEPPSEYELWASDVNTDGEINVLDVVGIVKKILGNNSG